MIVSAFLLKSIDDNELNRCHFVFIFSANNNALQNKRKTLTANDVFDALREMEFEQFVEPLQESLEGICPCNCRCLGSTK